MVMSTIALHSTLNISETIRNRGLVGSITTNRNRTWHQLSNGHVTDDVTWPERSNSYTNTLRFAKNDDF